MRAIIVAAAHRSRMYGLDERLPVPLFALGDRPILHHIVDYLAAQGIRQFEFVLGYLPHKIEAYLGDGARWGASFNFHLLASSSEFGQVMQAITASASGPVVLGRGDRLPDLQLHSAAGPTLYMTNTGDWTGWAISPRDAGLLAGLPPYFEGAKDFDARFERLIVKRELSFESAAMLLRSQNDLLNGTFPGSRIEALQTLPGVWISRNVSLHPTVTLQPPVYIGANCKITMGATIGPSVVIGEGSVVDKQTSIANAFVAADTYVGQGLELDHVIADHNLLVNTNLETAFMAPESFLLSSLVREKKPRLFRRLLSRTGAFALFVLLFPLASLTFLFLLLTRKGEIYKEQAVRIPSADDPDRWTKFSHHRLRLHNLTGSGWWLTFVTEVWPGLISVLKGDLFLVGLNPRTKQEIEKLPGHWRSIYLGSKAGLITEASVMFGRTPTEDELYIAEAYYTATASVQHDLQLLWLYLERMIAGYGRTNVPPTTENIPNGPCLENVAEP